MFQQQNMSDLAEQTTLAAMFDANPIAQVLLARDLTIVAANYQYCQITGKNRCELIGRNAFEVFKANPDDPDADNELAQRRSVNRVLETGETNDMGIVQHDIQNADGVYSVRYWRLITSPIFSAPERQDAPTHALVSVEDVTKTVLGDRVSEAKSRAAIKDADTTYFEYDPAAVRFDRTPQLDAMFGYHEGEDDESSQMFLERIHPEDISAVRDEFERAARTAGSSIHQDYRVIWPDGSVRWLAGRGESVRDPVTQTVRIVGVLLDVTGVKKDASKLREALAMQKLLLAEVNHRVKNSLQMVSSILRMEASSTLDQAAKDALSAANARVHAIATIHGALYEDDDVSSVQIDTYLERMRSHLEASLSSDQRSISLEVSSEPIRIETDKAIALSLAVNELVTNSFKHAAFESGKGTVKVLLTREPDGMIALSVSDDGIESSNQVLASSQSSGLGQTLIKGMALQLGGEVEEINNNGWTTRILFPE